MRITHPGNAPWPGNGTVGDRAIGRRRVNYNVGRFEVTSAESVEFFNAAFDRPASDLLPESFHIRPRLPIASSVPAPAGGVVILLSGAVLVRRRTMRR